MLHPSFFQTAAQRDLCETEIGSPLPSLHSEPSTPGSSIPSPSCTPGRYYQCTDQSRRGRHQGGGGHSELGRVGVATKRTIPSLILAVGEYSLIFQPNPGKLGFYIKSPHFQMLVSGFSKSTLWATNKAFPTAKHTHVLWPLSFALCSGEAGSSL